MWKAGHSLLEQRQQVLHRRCAEVHSGLEELVIMRMITVNGRVPRLEELVRELEARRRCSAARPGSDATSLPSDGEAAGPGTFPAQAGFSFAPGTPSSPDVATSLR